MTATMPETVHLLSKAKTAKSAKNGFENNYMHRVVGGELMRPASLRGVRIVITYDNGSASLSFHV